MKRLRDEVFITPQVKRPFGEKPNGPLQAASANGGGGRANVGTGVNASDSGVAASSTQKLTTTDALSYLKQVKDMFQHKREKYDTFLDVMKDFKGQRIDTAGVIGRVKELFDGHPNLILGFNTFLPKGYEITLTDEEEAPPKKTVEFEEAISFVNKIKKRFQNDDHVYKSFLDILNMYRKEHKVITEVYREVAALFGDHPDLLDEFTRFLPDTSATTAAPRTSLAHMDKEQQQRDMTIIPKGERDLSVERPDMEDDKTAIDKTAMKFHNELKRHTERENRDRKKRDQDDRDHNTENNGDISMHRLSDKKKLAQKVEEFGGTNLATFDDKDALKSTYNYEFSFCEKVKERLCSADDYQAFLKCLHIYSTEIITRKELQSLVADLLGKYPDIMEDFNEFLERCERIDGFLAGVMGKKSLWSEGNSSKASRIDEKENEPKRDLEGGKEKDRYNLKYWGKSIQELDLSNCERCTPSYRLLPEDYPIASASQRSELGAQVLNDHWVSVTSGSEDYSFNHMRRNQYEESLFRCEDDRFELDMLLECVSSTAKRAEELLNNITNNSLGPNGLLRLEEYFTALNLRCIERLYGDHGLDVVDILRKNSPMALPVILTRLKQKQEDWTKCRSDFNKVWADIYSKNHYKSLDHRSFYFKQQDSKNLSTKSLVAEIKEIKEKRQKEDDVLPSIAAGSRSSVIPDIEFEYADVEVHEDIFRIIKYSCEEVCSTKEQFNKVLRLWTTFLEPVLGVHCRPHGLETNEDDSSSKHPTVKNDASGIESEGSPNKDDTTTNLKQPKSNCNGDSNASPQRMNFSRTGLATVDSLAKEELAVRERVPTRDTAPTSGPVVNHGRSASSLGASNGTIEGGNEAKPNMEDITLSEGGEKSILNQLKYGDFAEGSRRSGYNEDGGPVDPCKNEKEEGELSPINDVEDNFGAYHNSSLQALPEKDLGNEGVQDQMGNHEEGAAGESGVDANNENSENISEAGEDVSGSNSAVEECSREEPEEEEDEERDDLDSKAESEGEADNASDFHYHGRDAVPQSERFLSTCTPLSKHVISSSVSDEKKDRRIFYGNDTFYVLFRLHQTLYERILSAKVNSVCSESKWRTTKDTSPDPYARFMSSLFSLLDGSSDNTKFEDDCRSLIGNHSYMLFTLDKLIYKLVKQLQTISGDELDCKLLQLYEYEKFRKPEKFIDSVYYENVNVLLHEENIYRLECTSEPSCLSIQLMDDVNVKSEAVAVSVDPKFATYLHEDYLSSNHGKKESSEVMLKRSMQKCSNQDESTALYKAMENVRIMNGLECKMSASSSKISYVIDTTDSFSRLGRRRDNRSIDRSSRNDETSVQQFHKFLTTSIRN